MLMRTYKRIDYTGRKFGLVTILGDRQVREGPNPVTTWQAVCECGNVLRVQISNLRYARFPSCGCNSRLELSLKMSKSPGFAAETMVLGYYQKNARKRGLTWDLTRDQFSELIAKACHYCGEVGSMTKTKHKDTIRCNGVDRVDSSKGYVPDNVVSCCKTCNNAKSSMSVAEFISWAKRLVAHQAI